MVFVKTESAGPCPPGAFCGPLVTELYASGRLVIRGENTTETTLDSAMLQKILEKMRTSRIMGANCTPASIVLDYGATYSLSLDGKNKTIEFPGCEEALREIESFLPPRPPLQGA
ncbi:MAG: hypothetical protein WC792_01425 [Candidatus Micrarchaeia archaeon]